MSLTEGLARLKEIDPATYLSIEKWGINFNHPDEVFLAECLIQGVIQMAIESKGWWWELYHAPEDFRDKNSPIDVAGGYSVTILTSHIPFWEDRSKYEFRALGDSPAEALLNAYVEACKCQ